MAVQKIKNGLAIILVGLFVLLPDLVLAGIPETINYQGYLTTSNNTPLHGEFPVTFRIYDSSTDGVALWEEGRNVTAFFGIVNVMLGEVTPLPPSLLFDRALLSWGSGGSGSGNDSSNDLNQYRLCLWIKVCG